MTAIDRLPCGGDGFAQGERSFIEAAADDHAGDADGIEPADVVNFLDPAGSDDRGPHGLGQGLCPLDVRSGQHPILGDVGVDDRGQRQFVRTSGKFENGLFAVLEPAVRGDTSGKVMKPARIKPTGFELPVPAFVETGDKIEIDTRTDEYRRRI